MMEGLLFSLLAFSTEPVLPTNSVTLEDVSCLAENIYFEARSEDIIGQIAVAYVTINRVKDSRYPDSICAVVKQGAKKGRNKCQFSWYCDGKEDKMLNPKARKFSYQLANAVLEGKFLDITEGATHYHTNSTTPYWSKSLTRIAEIDSHTFYRWETANN